MYLRNLNRVLFLLLLLSFINPVFALNQDKKAPIQLDADKASIDEKKGRSIYSGNVVLTQGSKIIRADRLVVSHPKQKIEKITAEGNPAHFEQTPEGKGEKVHASALKMIWYEQKEEVHLLNEAQLQRGKNTFTGHKIIYNIKKETVEAKSTKDKKQRIHFTIYPDKKSQK